MEILKKFSELIDKGLETGDFEELKRLQNNLLYIVFCQSRDKEMTEGVYFPSLNPEYPDYFYIKPEPNTDESIKDFFNRCDADYSKFVDKFDKQPRKTDEELNELRKEAIKRLESPVLWVTARWNKEAIKEITEYDDYITLFETALLIGYRVDHNPLMIIHECPALFLDALSNKQIDPRHPFSKIPYSKLHKSPQGAGELVFFEKDAPNLSWRLTLKEAAEFAILKGYPEHLFSDLMSDNPADNTPTEPLANTQTTDNELSENDKTKYLRIIGLLAETLANTNPCDLRRKSDNTIIFGNGEAGVNNKTNLLKELVDTLSGITKSPPHGLSKTTLRDTINAGIKALHDSL